MFGCISTVVFGTGSIGGIIWIGQGFSSFVLFVVPRQMSYVSHVLLATPSEQTDHCVQPLLIMQLPCAAVADVAPDAGISTDVSAAEAKAAHKNSARMAHSAKPTLMGIISCS
jgi:hypothetical protein